MAISLSSAIVSLYKTKPSSYLVSHFNHSCQMYSSSLSSSSFRTTSLSEGTESGVTDEDPPTYSGPSTSSRTQLDLLEQLTSGYQSDDSISSLTIRDQLAQLVGDRDDDFSIPLGKNLKKVSPKFLTVSQKRNIKRQAYLNEVSKRNDSVTFATIGAFVLVPPLVILGIAIATGYVNLDSLL
ncbi:hypothetical protein Leryth_025789 [Lithospermum erythrorhizon]|nr:hypothetical protein Leryth_025789 [Lithospermum erythrorhizon]